MASPSLTQSCVSSQYQIDQAELEKAHCKLVQVSSVLHIFLFWLENLSNPVTIIDLGKMQSIAFLLDDLITEIGGSLPEI